MSGSSSSSSSSFTHAPHGQPARGRDSAAEGGEREEIGEMRKDSGFMLRAGVCAVVWRRGILGKGFLTSYDHHPGIVSFWHVTWTLSGVWEERQRREVSMDDEKKCF